MVTIQMIFEQLFLNPFPCNKFTRRMFRQLFGSTLYLFKGVRGSLKAFRLAFVENPSYLSNSRCKQYIFSLKMKLEKTSTHSTTNQDLRCLVRVLFLRLCISVVAETNGGEMRSLATNSELLLLIFSEIQLYICLRNRRGQGSIVGSCMLRGISPFVFP